MKRIGAILFRSVVIAGLGGLTSPLATAASAADKARDVLILSTAQFDEGTLQGCSEEDCTIGAQPFRAARSS